jgi:hypothetical protein
MSITVEWDNDAKTVIRFTYVGQWDLKQFYDTTEQSNALMASVDHKVDVILDVRKSSLIPKNFVSTMRTIRFKTHPHTGSLVLVGGNMFMRTLTNALTGFLGKSQQHPFTMTETLEEARAILANHMLTKVK